MANKNTPINLDYSICWILWYHKNNPKNKTHGIPNQKPRLSRFPSGIQICKREWILTTFSFSQSLKNSPPIIVAAGYRCLNYQCPSSASLGHEHRVYWLSNPSLKHICIEHFYSNSVIYIWYCSEMSHLITPEAGAPGPNLRFPLLWEIPKEGGGAHLQKEEKGATSSQQNFTLSLSGFSSTSTGEWRF